MPDARRQALVVDPSLVRVEAAHPRTLWPATHRSHLAFTQAFGSAVFFTKMPPEPFSSCAITGGKPHLTRAGWLTERGTSRCYGRLSSTSRVIGTVSAHCDTQKTAHEPSSAESARRLSDPLCDPSGRTSRRRRSRPPVADQHFSLADLHILMCGECGSLPQHAVASPAQTVGQGSELLGGQDVDEQLTDRGHVARGRPLQRGETGVGKDGVDGTR